MEYNQTIRWRNRVIIRALVFLTILFATLLPTTSNALRGGKVIKGFPGVVELNNCTGSMIAPNVILTAAHCLDRVGADNPNSSGLGQFQIFYHDPNDGRRLLFSTSSGMINATWHVSPSYKRFSGRDLDYAGDANADFGLIVISMGTSALDIFADTNYLDYLRIYADKKEFLSDTKLYLYGAGMHAYSGNSDDKLRTHWFEVENVEYNHIVVDTRDKVSSCKGDSGGPYIYNGKASGINVPMITGVSSGMETGEPWFEGDNCSHNDPPHDDAFASRISWKVIQFIEQKTGIQCSVHTNASKKYVRCFDVPFIEDVEYEGLERNLAVAITVSSII